MSRMTPTDTHTQRLRGREVEREGGRERDSDTERWGRERYRDLDLNLVSQTSSMSPEHVIVLTNSQLSN